MTDSLGPKDQAEAIAQFRAQVIGPLLCRTFDSHGELAAAIRELALEPVRPPGAEVSRTFAASTLERWYYAHRQGGLSALQPQSRVSGSAGALSEEQRDLLLGIRREYPTVSTALIVRTLECDGRLPKGLVSEPTVRRLFAAHGSIAKRLPYGMAGQSADAGQRPPQTSSGTPMSATAPPFAPMEGAFPCGSTRCSTTTAASSLASSLRGRARD